MHCTSPSVVCQETEAGPGNGRGKKRAARALSLVRQGELSSARMALEGAEVAPGNLGTLVNLPIVRRDLQGPGAIRARKWFTMSPQPGGQQVGPRASHLPSAGV